MTEEYKYQPIERARTSFGLFYITEFTPEESNRIIKNLVNKIEEYERFKDVEVKYQKNFNDKGIERIIEVEIKNNLIDGKIIYRPISNWGFMFSLGPSSADILAKIYFSKKFNDRKEYLGLVKIIEDSGLKRKS